MADSALALPTSVPRLELRVCETYPKHMRFGQFHYSDVYFRYQIARVARAKVQIFVSQFDAISSDRQLISVSSLRSLSNFWWYRLNCQKPYYHQYCACHPSMIQRQDTNL